MICTYSMLLICTNMNLGKCVCCANTSRWFTVNSQLNGPVLWNGTTMWMCLKKFVFGTNVLVVVMVVVVFFFCLHYRGHKRDSLQVCVCSRLIRLFQVAAHNCIQIYGSIEAFIFNNIFSFFFFGKEAWKRNQTKKKKPANQQSGNND